MVQPRIMFESLGYILRRILAIGAEVLRTDFSDQKMTESSQEKPSNQLKICCQSCLAQHIRCLSSRPLRGGWTASKRSDPGTQDGAGPLLDFASVASTFSSFARQLRISFQVQRGGTGGKHVVQNCQAC